MESQFTNGKRKAPKEKIEKGTKKVFKNDKTASKVEKKGEKKPFANKGNKGEGGKSFEGKPKFHKKFSEKSESKFEKKIKPESKDETEDNFSKRQNPATSEGDSFFKYLNRLTQQLWTKKESKKPKDQIVKEILGKVLPVLGKVINKRNGSKTVQACLKYGSEKQIENIVNELIKAQYFEDMIKSKYGHYLALRVIKKSDKAQREKIFYQIKSNIVFFAAHKVFISYIFSFFLFFSKFIFEKNIIQNFQGSQQSC